MIIIIIIIVIIIIMIIIIIQRLPPTLLARVGLAQARPNNTMLYYTILGECKHYGASLSERHVLLQ